MSAPIRRENEAAWISVVFETRTSARIRVETKYPVDIGQMEQIVLAMRAASTRNRELEASRWVAWCRPIKAANVLSLVRRIEAITKQWALVLVTQ